jgi:NADH:ubiquinone oxidoreductase subunit E
MNIQICIGSSCHLRGSADLIEMFQNAVEKYALTDKVTLAGSFCMGRCNRIGVTVAIDDDIYTGLTRETFNEFFKENVLKKLQKENA